MFSTNLANIPNAESYFMASFDVENLFTNVPLPETIEIFLKLLYTNASSTVLGLTRSCFKTFLEMSVLNSFFLFDNKLYKHGITFGSYIC